MRNQLVQLLIIRVSLLPHHLQHLHVRLAEFVDSTFDNLSKVRKSEQNVSYTEISPRMLCVMKWRTCSGSS